MFKPDIVSLQEIKLDSETANMRIRFAGYATYIKTRKVNPSFGGGLAIIVKEGIPHAQIPLEENNAELLGIQIDLDNFSIDFYSYYCPPNKIIARELFESYFDNKKKLLLVGDLNSKTPVVGCKSLDPSGRVLESILLDSDLVVFNGPNPTYKRFQSDYEEILDLVIGSSIMCNKITELEILEDYSMGSDHLPVSFSLNLSLTLKNNYKAEPRFNLAKANWNLYHSLLSKRNSFYSKDFLCSVDASELNSMVINDILAAACHSIPKFTHKLGKTLPKDILSLIKERKEIKKRIKKDPEKQKPLYNKLTSQIRKSITNYYELK